MNKYIQFYPYQASRIEPDFDIDNYGQPIYDRERKESIETRLAIKKLMEDVPVKTEDDINDIKLGRVPLSVRFGSWPLYIDPWSAFTNSAGWIEGPLPDLASFEKAIILDLNHGDLSTDFEWNGELYWRDVVYPNDELPNGRRADDWPWFLKEWFKLGEPEYVPINSDNESREEYIRRTETWDVVKNNTEKGYRPELYWGR